MPDEHRLDELREQARNKGVVTGRGVDIAGGPIPRKLATASPSGGKPGYYGEPVVRPPVWTWEIPVYFFVGGLAGMAAVIALIGLIFHQGDLTRTAVWIAAIGAILSPILLIMDLGRPRLFLNMLRVFKHQSPMSVGAWILFVFGGCAVPALITLELHAHQIFTGGFDHFLQIAASLLILGSAFWGMFLAAGTETALWIWLEIDKHGKADRALRESGSGLLIRCAEILSGPLALILRVANLVPLAGISLDRKS